MIEETKETIFDFIEETVRVFYIDFALLIDNFSNWQLNKLKSRIKNDTELTLNLSSNKIGDSNNETKFPHTFLLTDIQLLRLCKPFANNSSANLKLSKNSAI